MNQEEATRLVRLSKEMGNLFHQSFTETVDFQFQEAPQDQKHILIKSKLENEYKKLQQYELPDYFHQEQTIIEHLTLDSTTTNKMILFDKHYSCFTRIEEDSDFLSKIIKHYPELIQDGIFISQRSSYLSQYDFVDLCDSEFYFNVYVIVLAFSFYTQNNIAYLKQKIALLSDLGNGLNCVLNIEQKKQLHGGLIREQIIESTESNFIAAMTNEPLPLNFNKVKWLLTSKKNRPHKTAFREFLELYCEPTHGRSTNVPHQNDINRVFCDADGYPIKLLKPTRDRPSNHYSFFEELI